MSMIRLVLLFLILSLLLAGLAVATTGALPEVSGKTGPTRDFFSDEATQLWIGPIGKAVASSTLPASASGSYTVANLADFKAATAWVEGKTDDGIGESISFTFAEQAWNDEAYAFSGTVYLVNGYAKSRELFLANNRVKRLRVSYNGKPLCVLGLADSMDLQTFDLRAFRPALRKKGDVLRFEILEVYRGTKYRDTCLTELQGGLNGN